MSGKLTHCHSITFPKIWIFSLQDMFPVSSSALPVASTLPHYIRNHMPSILIPIKKSNKMQQCTKIYFIFIWSSTCFGRHTAHHQEPKTALAASGFACVEGCWTCSCWTLTASSNYYGTEFHPDPARKLSANLYDIYHCCVYSEVLLMMDRETVWNMYNFFFLFFNLFYSKPTHALLLTHTCIHI
jgi:hypothetical protein